MHLMVLTIFNVSITHPFFCVPKARKNFTRTSKKNLVTMKLCPVFNFKRKATPTYAWFQVCTRNSTKRGDITFNYAIIIAILTPSVASIYHGGVHKLRQQDFANFWPPSPLHKQVYYISLCSSISIWLPPSPSLAYVVYGSPQDCTYILYTIKMKLWWDCCKIVLNFSHMLCPICEIVERLLQDCCRIITNLLRMLQESHNLT